MRRTLIIIAGIIVLIGIAVGVYFLVWGGGSPKLTVGVPNPFGGSGEDRANTDTGNKDLVQGAGSLIGPHLIKITDGPVAEGAVALDIAATAAPAVASSTPPVATPADTEVRYIERQSGNIFAFRLHDRILTRIGNKTLPGIQTASWLPDGSRAFVQFLEKGTDANEHIDTYSLPAAGSDGYFLEQDLSQASVIGSSSVVSLLPTSNGSIASVASALGTNVRTLFSSPLAALRLDASGKDFIATTKASATSDGYAFFVGSKDGVFTRLLGPFNGLTTLASPDGTSLIYSYTDHGKVHLNLYDIKTHFITALPLATLSEKCAWAPGNRSIYCGVPTNMSGTLPDDWYQGVKSFTDRIWRIDLDTRTATLIVDPTQVGSVSIDAVALTLDAQSDILVFTNHSDGSLWAYDL